MNVHKVGEIVLRCAELVDEERVTGVFMVWTDNKSKTQALKYLDSIPPKHRNEIGKMLREFADAMDPPTATYLTDVELAYLRSFIGDLCDVTMTWADVADDNDREKVSDYLRRVFGVAGDGRQ